MAFGEDGAGLVRADPVSGLADDGVQDDLVAVLVGPGGVAAEDHRQLVLGEADAAQGPEVVVVEGGGPDVDGGPARTRTGSRAFAQLKAVEGVVAVDAGCVGGEHGADDRPGGGPA